MKKLFFAFLAFALLGSCKEKEPVVTPPAEEEASKYAIDLYWADDYDGKLGVQVSDDYRMTLAGETMYVTGINCYNLFVQSVSGSAVTKTSMEKTVEVMKAQEVPFVRFSCSPYYPSGLKLYNTDKEAYLECLDYLGTLCDEAHILIMPSVYWNTSCLPEYFEENIDQWGNKESQTYKFMLNYTKEIVETLRGHKCLAVWEFGNEFNLAADIDIAGYPDIKASAVGTALQGFGEVCQANDPQGRMIASGHSVMRNAQWHLAYKDNWTTDSYDEYVEITGVMTPSPVNGMSEHIYEDPRKFYGLGTLSRDAQLIKSMACAKSLGKVFYAGEFTGTADADDDLVKAYYQSFYDTRVQLSLIWNYALLGDIEHSFKAGTHAGNVAFSQMRKLNEKYREDSLD